MTNYNENKDCTQTVLDEENIEQDINTTNEEIDSTEVNLVEVKESDLLQLKQELENAVQALQDEKDASKESKEKELRAYAEMENIRRRADKSIESAHKFALEKFVKSLLPVIDSMEKAIEYDQSGADENSMAEGVKLTMKMFLDAGANFGLTQLNPLGEKFDPNMHEAMMMQANPEKENDTIEMVLQKGYLLNERVIRPSRVAVIKNT